MARKARMWLVSMRADAADAETVGDRELARIDDVAAILQRVVEALEDEARIFRHVEGVDDRRLKCAGSSGLKPSVCIPSDSTRPFSA